MIRIEQLDKFYGAGEARTRVLDSVDLTIDEGAFVAIIGTSGSGKTTLLNIIGGLDASFSGKVEVGGQPLAGLRDRELARLRSAHFGFVFQQFNLLDHLTARENVMLPGYFRADHPGQAASRARAEELLARVGLGDRLADRPPKLSGGQRQRIAIARALFNHPRVLLCDEPTGSLDRSTGVEIMELFQRLNREDEITVIMVTHEEHVAQMASRIIRLEDGVVVADTPNQPQRPSLDGLTGVKGAT